MREGVTGIIVAGGLSRRFGSDKASASLRGRPLLQWVRDALAPVVDEIVAVTAAGQALPPMHPAIPVTVVEDREPERGPLAGLAAGFAAAVHGDAAGGERGSAPRMAPDPAGPDGSGR